MDSAFKSLLKSKVQEIAADYLDYEKKVLHRAAYSLNCEPYDLDKSGIKDMYFKDLSQFEAARQLENSIYKEMEEAYAERS